MNLFKKNFYLLLLIVLLASCKKEKQPNYTHRMIYATERPRKYSAYRFDSSGVWLDVELPQCALDDIYNSVLMMNAVVIGMAAV